MGKGKKNREERKQAFIQAGNLFNKNPQIELNLPAIHNGYASMYNAQLEAKKVPVKVLEEEIRKYVSKMHADFERIEPAAILLAMYRATGLSYYKLLEFYHHYDQYLREITYFFQYDYDDENNHITFEQILRDDVGIDMDHIKEQCEECFGKGSKVTPRTRKFEKRYKRNERKQKINI